MTLRQNVAGLVLSIPVLCCQTMAASDTPESRIVSAPVRDKTLVAWVRLDNLDQVGSGVLSIQDGDEFDALTYGERSPRRWMAGSHMFQRTQSMEEQRALELEKTHADQWRMIAIVYRGKRIEIYRDGWQYASYETDCQQTYVGDCDLYLGLRCIFRQQRYGFLQGAIDKARIYNEALDGETVARLEPGQLTEPRPLGCWTFEGDVARDVMGHYPTTRLVGTALMWWKGTMATCTATSLRIRIR